MAELLLNPRLLALNGTPPAREHFNNIEDVSISGSREPHASKLFHVVISCFYVFVTHLTWCGPP